VANADLLSAVLEAAAEATAAEEAAEEAADEATNAAESAKAAAANAATAYQAAATAYAACQAAAIAAATTPHRWRRLAELALAAAMGAGVALLGARQEEVDRADDVAVRAGRFEVVDASGVVRAALMVGDTGAPGLGCTTARGWFGCF
jgi:hypothetical protein